MRFGRTSVNIRRAAFRFNPDSSLIIVLLSIGSVVASLSAATFVATPENGIAYFVLYAVLGAGLCGIAGPMLYTVFALKGTPADLGLHLHRLPLSLGVQALCFAPLAKKLVRDSAILDIAALVPLVALALAVGFFEAVFWRGWVYRRLESAFGVIPALIAGAALYALYHVGYGMSLDEMAFLFFIGLVFNAVYAATGSVFSLWPFFQPAGQLLTLIKDDLDLPLIATVGFLEVLAGMIVLIVILRRVAATRAAPAPHSGSRAT